MGLHPHGKVRRQCTDGGTDRRTLLAAGGAALVGTLLPSRRTSAAPVGKPAFEQRGYYITFMRMPTYGLAAWKRTVDAFTSDGIHLLILWMAGGFRSKRFPVTWRYNAEHENVRGDFAGELIRYAQGKRVRVLLGLTPYGYDGVNQYALERPELRARKKDGQPVDEFGIHCWGWNLCPSRDESRRFMLDYAREMVFEFYPHADGLLIESSDYAICHCPDCDGRYYEREFEFVRTISDELWKARRDATVVVYPHYFSGSAVPGMDERAARQPFDPRWALFFTPHSAHLDAALIGAATRGSLWSDDAPALHDPQAIRGRARQARAAGVSGYVPSLEAFSYVPTHAEEGRADLVGKRQVPFGFGWLKPEEMPYDELPLRVNRIAFREFSNDPELAYDEFQRRLGREVFGSGEVDVRWCDDLMTVHRAFFQDRTWCQPSPVVSPAHVRADVAAGRATRAKLAEYANTLKQLGDVAVRHAGAANRGRAEVHRIARWVLDQWGEADLRMLEARE